MAVKFVTARRQTIIMNPSFRVEGVPIERDAPSVELSYHDGAVSEPKAARIRPRQFTISGHFYGDSAAECRLQRQRVVQALMQGPVEIYEDALDDQFLMATFIRDTLAYVPQTGRMMAEVSLQFRADSPYYLSAQQSKRLGSGGTINNPGFAPSAPIITIYGAVTNPSVTNTTTGQTLAIDDSIASGTSVLVDCERFTAQKGGVGIVRALNNAFLIDGFRLDPGSNIITVTGSGTKDVLITWTPRYY